MDEDKALTPMPNERVAGSACRLPHSCIEVDLPLIATFSAKHFPDRGQYPDIPVQLTIDDITSGIDADMAMVNRLTV